MKTAAERKQAERTKKRTAGLVRCEVYVLPQHKPRIRAYAAKLRKKEPQS